MAERLAYLEAVVGADVSNFRRGMSDVRNEVGFLSDSMKGLAGVGRGLTFAFTAPMVALGTATVAAASTFQASMQNINAIAGLTGNELDELSQRALEFGANTRSGAHDAADALYTVFSAGISNTEDAFSAMQVATYTAEAGLSDLTVTTEAMLAVMLAYGDTGEEMAWRVSNAMTQMVAVGVGSMEEFAGALGNVVPTAQSLGMSIEELMGDMAFMTQRGLSAAKAGTALNSALTALIKPSEAMSAAMHELGASSAQELIDNFGGVNGALEALIGHADGSQEALAAMFGNIRGLRAVNLFASDVEGWGAALEEFNGALDGATLRAWDSQMQSFSASWDMLQSAVQGAAIAIGTKLFPILQPVVDGMRNLVIQITTVSPEIMGMAVAIATAAAAAPPLLWIIASLISPLGAVIAAVTALGVAFSTNFLGISDTVVSVVSDIQAALAPITAVMAEFWDGLMPEEEGTFSDKITKGLGGRVPDPFSFLTVEKPTSLWDIYEQEGFIETMSWDEFMLLATEGGWEGGAITPDNPLTLDLGVEISDDPLGIDELKNNNSDKLKEVEPMMRSAVADTMTNVFADLWAVISPEVAALSNLFVAWVDGVGSTIIEGISAWGEGIDASAMLDGFKNALSGGWGWVTESIGSGGDALNAGVSSWFDNIQQSLPQVTSSIGELLTNAKNWLLTEGVALFAEGVGFLAGSIGTFLSDAVVDGVAYLSNLGGAIDTSGLDFIQTDIIDPLLAGFAETGLVTKIQKWTSNVGTWITKGLVGWGTRITQALPDIQAKMTKLMTGIGTYIITKGIPALSHSFGFLSGRIAVLLQQAISMGISAFSGGGGAGAAGMMSAAGAYMNESVVTPFQEGMEEATAGSDLAGNVWSTLGVNIETDMAAGIAGINMQTITDALGVKLSEFGTWLATDGLNLVAEKIGYMVGRLGALLVQGIAMLGSYLSGDGGGELAGAGADVVGSFQTGFGEAMGDTGMTEAGGEMMAGFAAALALGATAVVFTPVVAAVGAAIGAASMAFSWLTTGASVMTPLAAAIKLKAAAVSWAGVTSAIGTGVSSAAAGIAAGASWVVSAAGSVLGAIGAAITSTVFLVTLGGIALGALGYLLLPEEFKQQFRAGLEAGIDSMFGEGAYEGTMVSLNDWAVDTAGWAVNTWNGDTPDVIAEQAAADYTGSHDVTLPPPDTVSIDLSSSGLIAEMPPLGEGIPIAAEGEALAIDLTGVSTSFTGDLMAGTSTDTIIAEQLMPLETAWVDMFSPDGLMSVNFGLFSSGVTTGFNNISAAATSWSTKLTEMIPPLLPILADFASGALLHIGGLMVGFKEAAGAAGALRSSIIDLAKLDASLTVDVQVSGNVNGAAVDGSHQSGLASVPFDGYISELHKGERVLTAREADEYNKVSRNATSGGGSATAGASSTTNYITISGVQDTDQLIRDLKRRGIYLDG